MNVTTPEQVLLLACAFGAVLRQTLSHSEMQRLVDANALRRDDSCASHDFCDANMVMAEAFREVHGREVVLPCDVDEGSADQHQHDADVDLWNRAWSTAKAARFEHESDVLTARLQALQALMQD